MNQQDLEEAFGWEDPYKVMLALETPIYQRFGKAGIDFNKLSTAERVVVLINWFRAEVSNGGFHQFFTNSSGEYSLEVLHLLGTIGATNSVRLLEEALSVFPDGRPMKTQLERGWHVDNAGEKAHEMLGLLDDTFYDQEEDVLTLTVQYLKSRKSDFLSGN